VEESEQGSSASHPVRLAWLSALQSSDGSIDNDAVMQLGNGNRDECEKVVGLTFARTNTFDRVDRRLIGPEILLHKNGKVLARSKLTLEASVKRLVSTGQIN
jgi:hypothetical protein